MDSMIGQVLGHYRLVRKISEGCMGAVYYAEHELIGKPAAVKLLLEDLCGKREIVDRFFNEARATTSIQHPGIIEIYDFGYHSDGQAYLVMEYLRGETLGDRLERLGKLPQADAISIIRAVASAVGAAHQAGVVHRDLKPDNVFLVPDPEMPTGERAKVLDFGIAKLTESDDKRSAKTRTGAVMGTPTYMSPEQCRGAGEVDQRTDIYALGCILFEMLTGRPPFLGEGWGEIIAAHLTEAAPRVRTLEPSVSADVDEVVDRLLSKRPEQRLQTMDEVRRAFGGRFSTGPVDSQPRKTDEVAAAAAKRTPMPTTLGSAAAQSVEMEAQAPPRRSMAFAGILAAILIAVGIVVVAVLASGGEAKDDAPPAEPVAAAEPPPVAPTPDAAAAAPETIAITLDVAPAGATVAIDGIPSTENPIVLPRAEGQHQVTVSADGFVTREFKVAADRDSSHHIGLTAAKPATRRAKPLRAAPVTPRATTPKPPRPIKKKAGPLETDL
ncbi:MAG TPA: serine/threonine-protein kinase [Kofleriaceae bacterium]|nr:serine/threonine-protein kinase [Kofleriaceae bacterium]